MAGWQHAMIKEPHRDVHLMSPDSVNFDLGRRCDGGDLPKMGVAKEAQRVEMGEIPKK